MGRGRGRGDGRGRLLRRNGGRRGSPGCRAVRSLGRVPQRLGSSTSESRCHGEMELETRCRKRRVGQTPSNMINHAFDRTYSATESFPNSHLSLPCCVQRSFGVALDRHCSLSVVGNETLSAEFSCAPPTTWRKRNRSPPHDRLTATRPPDEAPCLTRIPSPVRPISHNNPGRLQHGGSVDGTHCLARSSGVLGGAPSLFIR